MRGALFLLGFLVFALGIVLSLPTIVLNAAGSDIQTKGQAITFIAGNVVKDVSSLSSKDSYTGENQTSFLSKIPSLSIVIGLVLILLAFLLKL